MYATFRITPSVKTTKWNSSEVIQNHLKTEIKTFVTLWFQIQAENGNESASYSSFRVLENEQYMLSVSVV